MRGRERGLEAAEQRGLGVLKYFEGERDRGGGRERGGERGETSELFFFFVLGSIRREKHVEITTKR